MSARIYRLILNENVSRLRRILPFRVVRAKLHEYAQRKRISTKYLPRLHARTRSRATHAREIARATRNRRAVRVLRPNFQAISRPLPRLEGVPRIYLPRVQLRPRISRRLRARRRTSARLFGAFNGSGEYYSEIIKTQPNKNKNGLLNLATQRRQSSRKPRPKYASSNSNGQQISINPTETPIRTPFGPSRFDKAQTTGRQSLEFRCNPEIMESFARFDEWAVAYLTEHSERIFKKPLTKEQIVEMYRSPVSQKGDYPALLRTKINLDVGGTCRFWSSEGNHARTTRKLEDRRIRPAPHNSKSLDHRGYVWFRHRGERPSGPRRTPEMLSLLKENAAEHHRNKNKTRRTP